MIVRNITYKVDPSIEGLWIVWQKEEHILNTMSSGLCSKFSFYRLLDQEDEDGVTYIIQYFFETIDQLLRYYRQEEKLLQQAEKLKWGNKFVSFSTTMEPVDE